MASTANIVLEDYNNAVDIDLHMKFGIDDEVTINGDLSAAHIDNRYEAGFVGIQVLPLTLITPQCHHNQGTAPLAAMVQLSCTHFGSSVHLV